MAVNNTKTKTTKKETKKKTNIIVTILSVIFGLLAVFGVIGAFMGGLDSASTTKIIISSVGLSLLAVSMNIADRINVDKNNSQTMIIACGVLEVISIPLIFFYLVYSYVLAAPALILSKKNMKTGNKIATIEFVASLIIIVAGIVSSILAMK